MNVESDDLNDFLSSPNLTARPVRWVDVEWFEVTGTSTGFFPYQPRPRSSWFSSGMSGGHPPDPAGLRRRRGRRRVGTGKILGAKLSRSGSFLRATSGGGG